MILQNVLYFSTYERYNYWKRTNILNEKINKIQSSNISKRFYQEKWDKLNIL